MKKFKIVDIQQQPISIEKLEVQSFEMNVYLVKLYVAGEEGFVFDEQNRPMRFYSAQQIRNVFEPCTVGSAALIHDSPYDEMIGNPEKAEQGIALPFSMQQPY